MKTLPSELAGTNSIFMSIRGAIQIQAIVTATELGIFSYLTTARSAAQTASALGLHEVSTKYFLELLTVLGALEKKGEKFYATAQSLDLYSPASYASALPLLRVMYSSIVAPLQNLTTIVRNGPVTPQAPAAEFITDMTISSAAWAFRGVAEQLATDIAALPGAKNFRRILDLGGGHGVFSLYLAQALPHAHVEIMDRPEVLEHAKRYISEWKGEQRISFIPADYEHDAIAAGYDCVLASCTLNFTLPQNSTGAVMYKIHAALHDDGYFVGLHDALALNRETALSTDPCDAVTECVLSAIFSGIPMAMPQGLLYGLMEKIGFRQVQSRRYNTKGGVFSLDIGRK